MVHLCYLHRSSAATERDPRVHLLSVSDLVMLMTNRATVAFACAITIILAKGSAAFLVVLKMRTKVKNFMEPSDCVYKC